MPDDRTTDCADIEELRERVRRLELQVAELAERRPFQARSESSAGTFAAARVPPTQTDADETVATVFVRVAMLSFALLGALILRVLTQQQILAAGFGTLLGFVYASQLIMLSLLPGRLGRLARETSFFQCCGVVLAFFIALESALRSQTIGRTLAMALIAFFGALALVVAVRQRKLSLASTALVGGLLAMVSLGLESKGLGLELASLVAFAAAGAALSWRRGWGLLRLPVFLLLMLLLAVGLAIARKESLDCGPLLASALAFWAVVALQQLAAFRGLRWAAAWLPVTTVWLACIGWAESQPGLSFAASGLSVASMAAVALAVRRYSGAPAGTAGLVATAVIAGTIGLPALDPGGVLCALAGAALWTALRRRQAAWAAGAAFFLMLAASVRGAMQLLPSTASPYAWISGALLAAILLTHFWRTETFPANASAPLARTLTSLTFVAGLVVLFAVLHNLALWIMPAPASYQLAQTGILVVAAMLLTWGGRAAHRRTVLYGGLACMFLSLLKVVFLDLGRLSGIRLLASIVLLGISSVAVSLILRRRD